MANQKIKNRVQHGLEIFLILVLVVSGIGNMFASPIVAAGGGPVVAILGSFWALIFYGTVFASEGLVLLYSKVFKKKNLRKHILFIIYLTIIFTVLLEILLTGFGWINFLDNILLAAMAGWCWIHWKMRIEYVDPGVFKKEIEELTKE